MEGAADAQLANDRTVGLENPQLRDFDLARTVDGRQADRLERLAWQRKAKRLEPVRRARQRLLLCVES